MNWENYETRHIALNVFDMFDFQDHPWLDSSSTTEVANHLKEVANNVFFATNLDFLSDVNWNQIAEHLMQAQEA